MLYQNSLHHFSFFTKRKILLIYFINFSLMVSAHKTQNTEEPCYFVTVFVLISYKKCSKNQFFSDITQITRE